MFETVDMKGVRGNVVAAANYMRSRDDTNGKVGIVGFCWGGGVVNTLAVADPKLNAASVFYGVPPDAKEVPNIKAALLLNYADPKLDPRLGKMVPAYRAELDKAHIPYEFHFYEGANHAFNDDTNQARYNKDAATQAWNRTLDLFKKNLS
jgi:carboxymethylenebutenolidase